MSCIQYLGRGLKIFDRTEYLGEGSWMRGGTEFSMKAIGKLHDAMEG